MADLAGNEPIQLSHGNEDHIGRYRRLPNQEKSSKGHYTLPIYQFPIKICLKKIMFQL